MDPSSLNPFLAGMFGAFWGSFLGVLAVRIPAGESVFMPRSRCDFCKTPLRTGDLIPLLSWAILKGRCRTCTRRFLPEVPVSELLTCLFMILLAETSFPPFQKLSLLVFFTFALPLTLIDIRFRRLPHLLTAGAILGGLTLSPTSFGGPGPAQAVAGAILGFIPAGLVAHFYKKGLGMGDAFWLAAIGAFTGPQSLPAVLLVASGSGIAGGFFLHMFQKSGDGQSFLSTSIPFGPFLSAGGLLALTFPHSFQNFSAFLK